MPHTLQLWANAISHIEFPLRLTQFANVRWSSSILFRLTGAILLECSRSEICYGKPHSRLRYCSPGTRQPSWFSGRILIGGGNSPFVWNPITPIDVTRNSPQTSISMPSALSSKPIAGSFWSRRNVGVVGTLSRRPLGASWIVTNWNGNGIRPSRYVQSPRLVNGGT